MDRNKNPQQNQLFKSTYLCTRHRLPPHTQRTCRLTDVGVAECQLQSDELQFCLHVLNNEYLAQEPCQRTIGKRLYTYGSLISRAILLQLAI